MRHSHSVTITQNTVQSQRLVAIMFPGPGLDVAWLAFPTNFKLSSPQILSARQDLPSLSLSLSLPPLACYLSHSHSMAIPRTFSCSCPLPVMVVKLKAAIVIMCREHTSVGTDLELTSPTHVPQSPLTAEPCTQRFIPCLRRVGGEGCVCVRVCVCVCLCVFAPPYRLTIFNRLRELVSSSSYDNIMDSFIHS